MDWINHSSLEGKHAFLSASNNTWLRYRKEDGSYDYDRLYSVYDGRLACEYGTRMHAFAEEAISLGIRLPRNNRTLNLHINDAIKYRMTPEVLLYYSDNCFGTADAISFNNNILRIHDLKTGKGTVHMEQLEIYAALFCLEYGVDPYSIDQIILQIYQSNSVQRFEPSPDDIQDIMNLIIDCDRALNKYMEKAK